MEIKPIPLDKMKCGNCKLLNNCYVRKEVDKEDIACSQIFQHYIKRR